ncbi:MAG: hypothetical protein CVU66_00640 [Deltaproteobacteria bacterium HGW-Deltaproteobacteria-23]|nr:MAG: hypothetical protein CVU66_00640 [Deltaproteobacteria bacterium HGW-Deltaproteobacteria-23]
MTHEIEPGIDDTLCSYGVKGRSYYIRKRKRSRGRDGRKMTAFWLSKVFFSGFAGYASINIRIPTKIALSLVGLSNAEGIRECESYIAEYLCKDCQRQKSREPPLQLADGGTINSTQTNSTKGVTK